MKAIELEQLFPNQGQIPAEFDLTEPLEQKEYLVNGEMRAWTGKSQDVWSPIYIKTDKGLEQKRTNRMCRKVYTKNDTKA